MPPLLRLLTAALFTLAACSPAVRPAGEAGADARRDDAAFDGFGETGLPDGGADGGRRTQRFPCIGCPPAPFPEAGAPACSSDAATQPALVYPADGVMFPPNLNTFEVQFTPGRDNTLWEIDFNNGVTDVRATTLCERITSARGRATNVCGFHLTPEIWRAIVAPNRGRNAIRVTVRGTTSAQQCSANSAARQIRIAYDELPGDIYYWQSVVLGPEPRRAAGIYSNHFGDAFAPSTVFTAASTPRSCAGCHTLSRDGARITLAYNDTDDVFEDSITQLVDVQSKNVLVGGPGGARCSAGALPPGLHTFNNDHSLLLASYFKTDFLPAAGCTGTNRSFLLINANTGSRITEIALPAGVMGTQPDWSIDGRHVVFVKPGTLSRYTVGGMQYLIGDHHFKGGDLYTMDVTPPRTFGTARVLLRGTLPGETASAQNANYYPAYAPDSDYLAFDHVNTGDVYHNPRARLFAATSDGRGVVALGRANGTGTVTNSLPRWAPFVSRHEQSRIAWLMFSSTRSYGARLENDGLPNCYPRRSPADNAPQRDDFSGCARPQIWVTAVDLDRAAILGGRDPSRPAFWLPLQSLDSHNHMPQWNSGLAGVSCLDAQATCPGPGGLGCCEGTTCSPTTHACEYACIPRDQRCPGPHGEGCCDGIVCDSAIGRCVRGPG